MLSTDQLCAIERAKLSPQTNDEAVSQLRELNILLMVALTLTIVFLITGLIVIYLI
ncbi:hypothetical protein [Paraburkholderia caffeinilytica]|uniref:hypothetical protein n=1 Tax=Paraburkholderia caffeinilytica TaxID=1761016 RepID=UPI003D9FD599